MSANLTQTVLTLNKEFDKAQDNLHSIAQLCSQAEERIRKSQSLQNDFARQFHRLSEQTRQIITAAESLQDTDPTLK
ncbi:unnamed protein product [Amoebophrya sp. A120]|nr:unnamed protein product [Amoebophrya sp. A120]|eukprot:GSA120T00022516001.1